ncbi:RNA polymerase sigma-54 factor [Halobacillus andaensis]|uniref:RNA polymerase sigma-54 factor n=1 Tax=Halobacillus andaensis TaxID=1176239 RepID=A0A917B3N8_HALAA|nr:RNA polymerase factor sigma-54 [Halobacillus andaensis]MBP2004720.1 RNA polymerase sigma-54 factor [Halobacillus andaensis]GGF19515.1 RNA polymerase sigma-54 factor [Halobacillus andaensis]
MKLGLHQKQTTQLKMTKELRQAISLLQYSHQDMIEFIKEQAMENPLLELEGQGGGSDPQEFTVEDYPEASKDWRQSLLEQAKMLSLTSSDYSHLSELIESLDDQGFLPYSDEQLADRFHLKMSKIEPLRHQLKKLEPNGVGCYDFKEFLLFQVQESDHNDEVTKKIIQHHLPEVAAGYLQELADKLAVSVEDVQSSIQYVKTLQPRPLLPLSSSESYIVPDFTLEYNDGSYTVSLNRQGEPSVYITSYNQKVDKEGEEFLKQCFQRATWLIRSIEKRKLTMLKVAQAIIDKQTEYLDAKEKGPFTPLTLKKVAEEVEMHESTVSRTVADKYVKSSYGLFRLDQFFTSSLETNGGDTVSSQYVKELIEQQITQENKRKPLSDQRLADDLRSGYKIEVSRRTVAKYREELKIPSSPKRKLT